MGFNATLYSVDSEHVQADASEDIYYENVHAKVIWEFLGSGDAGDDYRDLNRELHELRKKRNCCPTCHRDADLKLEDFNDVPLILTEDELKEHFYGVTGEYICKHWEPSPNTCYCDNHALAKAMKEISAGRTIIWCANW